MTVTVRIHVVTYKEGVQGNVYQERCPPKDMMCMETVQKVNISTVYINRFNKQD